MTTLLTNAFPITLPFDEFQVSRISYRDHLQLAKLRKDHNATHSFFRLGDFIYCSPMVNGGQPLDGNLTTLSLNDNADVASRLIEHIFFRTFVRTYPDRKPIKFYPFTILSARDTHDLARGVLPSSVSGQISFVRQITIHLRKLETEAGPCFAFVPEISHRWRTSLTLSDMMKSGYPLAGLPVVHTTFSPGYSNVFASDEHFVGILKDHDNLNANVQTNSGVESFPLGHLHLRMQTEDVRKYLSHVLGEPAAAQAVDKIRSDRKVQFTPKFLFSEAQGLFKHLSQLDYSNLDSFTFSISPNPYMSPSKFTLENTKLCFDPTPGSVESSPLQGLGTHGPYDSQYFTPKDPNILVLCHHSVRGRTSDFLGTLQHGISQSRYYPRGMASLLRLGGIHFSIQDVKGVTSEDYEFAIEEALRNQNVPHYDCAIIVVQDKWKDYPPRNNPYLRAKAKLLTAGIPVQAIKEVNILQGSKENQYRMAPIAVQTYAKCGGIPWLLPAKSGVDVELVVGIGTTILRDNLWTSAEQSRFVGITTFFTGNGQFLMGAPMTPVPYEQYSSALTQAIRTTLEQLACDYHWKPGSSVRLIFHAHKPFKNIEADAVATLIKTFRQYSIKYSFVKISSDHPLLLLRGTNNQALTNALPAERGDNMLLNSNTALLELKSPGHGIYAKPIQVSLHADSTFLDFHYLCQQILDFSQLNWRSIQPSRIPITILYSELLAELWSKLKQTGHWDAVCLNTPQLRKSLWFL